MTAWLEKLVPGKAPDWYQHVVLGALLASLFILVELVSFIFKSGIARYQGTGPWYGALLAGAVAQIVLMMYEAFQNIIKKGHTGREAVRDIKNYGIGTAAVAVAVIFVVLLFSIVF